MRYAHITKTERLEIAILSERGYSQRDISRALGRNVSTVSREVRYRKTKGRYDPEKANGKARVIRQNSKYQGMKIVGNMELRSYVEAKLSQDWSPEAISGRIKEVERELKYVSAKGIYKFITSAYGARYLRRLAYKGRKRKSVPPARAVKLKNRLFIDKRPKIVETRGRFGDWEGDFIVSGKNGSGALFVLHERKARYTIIRKMAAPSIAEVHRLLGEMTGGIIMNTLTLDNDILFRKHEEMSRVLDAPVYFCHPYHSWEKGGVENTNKLIRRYVPKRTDISKASDTYILEIETKLNTRPRKCLRFKTPLEVMRDNNQLKTFKTFDIINPIKQKIPSVALEGSG